jgi:protein-S-isoprenylcysteine O-methyltransferase Ste14
MEILTRKSLFVLVWLHLALGALVFLSAGTFNFGQGWLFLGTFLACSVAITAYFLKYDPDLIAMRLHASPFEEHEPWQKLFHFFATLSFAAVPVIGGLDHRFHWSKLGAGWLALGCALMAFGFWIIFHVFRVNAFVSMILEKSEGQRVVAQGPYAFVRHPMYSGSILVLMGAALALGSPWALIGTPLIFASFMLRVVEEERFLTKNLAGYEHYRSRVHWRLVPGVW